MKRKYQKQGRLPCAQVHSDDCIDSRKFFREGDGRRNDRKDRQLCKQVYRILCTLLAGGFGDPVLQDMMVESVTPAPDASRLLVTVRLRTLPGRAPKATALEHLARLKGVLRSEVAAGIRRRKAPELVYGVAENGEVLP